MVPSSRYFMSSSNGSDNEDNTNDNVDPIPTSSSQPSLPLPSSDVIPSDISSSDNTPKEESSANRPILGEVSIDGSLLVVIPAIVISVLGIIFSIVVAFNARDEFVVDEVSSSSSSTMNLPHPPKKEVRVDDGRCRGICADQEGSLKDLSLLMESLRRTE